ncbi:MAG: acyl carrier protein [Candidatus Sulfotelmatobacter sp.]
MRIRSFVLQKFPAARKRVFNDDVQLLESGIIDSLGVLDVVGFLEQTFNIRVDDDDLTPENFGNVKCIGSFVEKKSGQSKVNAG